MNRVVIVGGGVIGVTTAMALARRGERVSLLERADALGMGTSARNGGQLSYSATDALASPAVIRHLPRLVAGLDPAFQIHPEVSADFIGWILKFLANCRASRFAENTLAVLRLALASRAALTRLRADHPQLDFSHHSAGKIHIYYDRAKFTHACGFIPLKNRLGCDQRALSREELMVLEPAFCMGGESVVGAIHSPWDEAGDCQTFTQALGMIAMREYGVEILTGMTADSLVLDSARVRAVATGQGAIEGERFVLAAGTDVAALARTAALHLPIYPMKGYSMTLPVALGAPRLSITDTRAKIVFSRLGERLRIAGMAELGRPTGVIDPHRVQVLLNAARMCLPQAADWDADLQAWTGLRPMTPDSRPIVGATPIDNLYLNCGHGMLGWTLACGSAELAAAIVCADDPADRALTMADDFGLARF